MSKTRLFKILECYFIKGDLDWVSTNHIDEALALLVVLAAWLGEEKGKRK